MNNKLDQTINTPRTNVDDDEEDFEDSGGGDGESIGQPDTGRYPYTSGNNDKKGPNRSQKEQQPREQEKKPQQPSETKYKNNILNYYFNDKSVNPNELTPR